MAETREEGLQQPLLQASGHDDDVEPDAGSADAGTQQGAHQAVLLQHQNGQHQNGLQEGEREPSQQGRGAPAAYSGPKLAAQGESLLTESGRVLQLALPVVASEVLSFCSYLITTAQVGHLSAIALSDFSLARTIFHITGLSLVVGLTSGSDTFMGQAFGAQQFGQVGAHLQRCVAINLVSCVAILAVWATAAQPLMTALRQKTEVVQGAVPLLLGMGPALVCWCFQVPLHSYMSSQGVVLPMALVAGAGTVATLGLNYTFITVLGQGLIGAVHAYVCLAVLELAAFIACIVWLHSKQPPGCKTWQGLDVRAAFRGWPAYLRIALPSAGMICLDWWSFEVMILVAGLQPDAVKQQGTMGVLFATNSLAFMVCSGYGTAAATRVSNELGAGHAAAARRATITSVLLSFVSSLLVAMLLMGLRRPWAHIYSTDPEVIEAVTGAMIFLCVTVVGDSVSSVLSGVLRGCGHQAIGFCANLGTLWTVGIPLAYRLDIMQGGGARGVWMALAVASLLQAIVLLVTVCSFSWERLAKRAQQLMAAGQAVDAASVAAAAGGPGGHHGVYEPLIGAPHA